MKNFQDLTDEDNAHYQGSDQLPSHCHSINSVHMMGYLINRVRLRTFF